MQVSKNGLELIASFEGLRLKAYKLKGEKYYTIGYGHSFDPAIQKDTVITKEKAMQYLAYDVAKFEKYVNEYVPIKMTQNMFDVLVSYSFNRGLGGLKQLIRNSKNAVEYANNIVVYWGSAVRYKNGLIRRRVIEQRLFRKDMYLVPSNEINCSSDSLYILWLQEQLNNSSLVCEDGKPLLVLDGVWGKKTDTALMTFIRKIGIKGYVRVHKKYHVCDCNVIEALKNTTRVTIKE